MNTHTDGHLFILEVLLKHFVLFHSALILSYNHLIGNGYVHEMSCCSHRQHMRPEIFLYKDCKDYTHCSTCAVRETYDHVISHHTCCSSDDNRYRSFHSVTYSSAVKYPNKLNTSNMWERKTPPQKQKVNLKSDKCTCFVRWYSSESIWQMKANSSTQTTAPCWGSWSCPFASNIGISAHIPIPHSSASAWMPWSSTLRVQQTTQWI